MKTYEKRLETASAVCWGEDGAVGDLASALNEDQFRVYGETADVAYEGGWHRLSEGEYVIVARGQAQQVLSAEDFNAQWREVALLT